MHVNCVCLGYFFIVLKPLDLVNIQFGYFCLHRISLCDFKEQIKSIILNDPSFSLMISLNQVRRRYKEILV